MEEIRIMKRKVLIVFSLCIMILSIVIVSLQAAGIPEDEANTRCDNYCTMKYPPWPLNPINEQKWQGCMTGCMYGYGYEF